MIFSKRTEWPTEENELTRFVSALRRDGVPLSDLTLTNPTRCGFSYLSSQLLQAFLDPRNLAYDPDPRGLKSARHLICAYYMKQGVSVQPEQVFLTSGTSEAYSFLFKLLFEPEDFLLAPQPSYPLLDYLASMHSIPIRRYALNPQNKWEMEFKGYYERQLEDPKAVLVVNPNNPTGNFLSPAGLAELNIFCKNRPIAIISDEVFLDYTLDSKTEKISTASNQQTLTFTLSGISKVLGLPQMKLSWIVVSGPQDQVQEACKRLEVISDTYLSVSTPAQNALEAWFGDSSAIQGEILARVRSNYAALKSLLGNSGSVRVHPIEGGWHAVLQMSARHSDEEWALHLLKKEHVLVHPGYLFDFKEGSFLVVSILCPEELFKIGIEKIKKAAEDLSVH